MPTWLSRLRLPTLPLYARLWLAVVLAVAVLTLIVGWAWRITREPPLREVVVRNLAGEVVGLGQMRGPRGPAPSVPPVPGLIERPRAPAAPSAAAAPPPSPDHNTEPGAGAMGTLGPGPQFTVRMNDGQTLHVHLPRPPRSPWGQAPFGFFWTLGLVALAVALATYPIIRRLTRRLERLQRGVERLGSGDLTARVPVQGNDEVAYLAQRFNDAAARIEALVQSHKSLLANASHELRTPLARIRMGLELLGPAASPTAQAEVLRNLAELDQLIDEILLASRLDARTAEVGSVELVDLVGLAAEECARVGATLDTGADDGDATVTPAPPLPGVAVQDLEVQGVAKLLRRALRNLLENARRYSRGEVRVQVSQHAGRARLTVCDQGPGVPAALRERIFEPFYRLPGASEHDGGVGLGLALVRAIAQRHGGQVRCEDAPGGCGACFVLELPCRPPN